MRSYLFSQQRSIQPFQCAANKGAFGVDFFAYPDGANPRWHELASIQEPVRVIRSEKASQRFASVFVRTDAEKEKARRWNFGLFQVSDEVRQGNKPCATHQVCLMDCTEPCCACQQQFNWHRGSMYRSPRDVRVTSIRCGHTATLARVGYVCTP